MGLEGLIIVLAVVFIVGFLVTRYVAEPARTILLIILGVVLLFVILRLLRVVA